MIGKLLGGRYKVTRFLGGGGGGETYVAVDTHRPRQPECVVKRLKPASEPAFLPIARRLFKREAETLERLGNHDQIPRLLAYFEEDEEFYLVQDLIEGHPLNVELPTGCSWSEVEVIHLLQDMLRILEFVHSYEVIHRDIKPANLIRRHEDSKIVLIDFGAVKEIRQNPHAQTQSHINPTTISIGTQGYMPSEQVRGKPRPSSDLYALGMIGIQALTGIDPVHLKEDQDGDAIWRQYAQVSNELAMILNGMVRYHFRDRYKTATEVLSALALIMHQDPLPAFEQRESNHDTENQPEPIEQEILPTEEIPFAFPEDSPINAPQHSPNSKTNSQQQRITQVSPDTLPQEEQTNQPQVASVEHAPSTVRQTIVSPEASPTPRQTEVSPNVDTALPVRQTTVSPDANSVRLQTVVSPDSPPVPIAAESQAVISNSDVQAQAQFLKEKQRRKTEIASPVEFPPDAVRVPPQNPRITEFSLDLIPPKDLSAPVASESHRSRQTEVASDSNYPPAPHTPPQRKESSPKRLLWLGLGGAIVAVTALTAIIWITKKTPNVEVANPSPQASEQTIPSPEAELKLQEADYEKLQEYLEQGKLREADQETYKLMLKLAGDKSLAQGRFDINEWYSLSSFCPDLRRIDELWSGVSKGRLGFSAQMKIYKDAQSPEEFYTRIGWFDPNTRSWKVEWEYNSTTKAAEYKTAPNFNSPPVGHLPAKLEWNTNPRKERRFTELFDSCDL